MADTALRSVVAQWKAEVDLKGFDRLNKRIELAHRGLEKLDKDARQKLKVDKAMLSIEGWKVNYIKQQNALLNRQAAIQKRSEERSMRNRVRNAAALRAAEMTANKAEETAARRRMQERRRANMQSRGASSGLLFGAGSALAGVGALGWKALKKGVDARESENLVNQVFGQDSGAMKQWSQNAAGSMGRSKYQFQDYAGRFGAFLTPMLDGQDTSAMGGVSGMSQQLSQLVIDLASFYNTSEDEARQRVYSGMAGETEAVRKLGVDLSDASLEAMNKSKGSNVAYNQLSMGDKTMLRFEKMLSDTTLAQGDAVRTQHDLANTGRALEAAFTDLMTELGKNLTPYAKEMAAWMKSSALPLFRKFAVETRGLVSGLEFLSTVVVAAGATYLATNLQMAGALAAMTASFIAFDEIRSAWEGKDSYLLDLFNWMAPEGETGWSALQKTSATLVGAFDVLGSAVVALIQNIIWARSKLMSSIPFSGVADPGSAPGLSAVHGALARYDANISGINSEKNGKATALMQAAMSGDTDTYSQITGAGDGATGEYLGLRRQAIASGQILPTEQDVADKVVDAQTYGPASPQQYLNGNRTQFQNTFNITGNNPQEISKAIADELAKQYRQASAAGGEEVEGASDE